MAYPQIYETIASYLNVSVETAIVILSIVSIWALIWKGFALWKSAKKNSKYWFIALLIINTLGILEILYIYVFSKMKPRKRKEKENKIKKK